MLEAIVDTNDEWITKRTGIGARHLLQPGETLSGCALSMRARLRGGSNLQIPNA